VTVPDAQILTIEPGVIVEFTGSSQYINVQGKLVAAGTEAERIVFTQASGFTGNWLHIYLNGSDPGTVLSYCDISYGGSSTGSVYFNSSGTNANMDHCTVSNSGSAGIHVASGTPDISYCDVSTSGVGINWASAGLGTVQNCVITGNTSYPLTVPATMVSRLSGMSVTGNAKDSIRVSGGATISENGTWKNFGVPYLLAATITINDAYSIAIEPGVVVALSGSIYINVQGKLVAAGTEAERIVFTRASGFTGNWLYLYLNGSDPGTVLSYCDISYGGSSSGSVYFNSTGTNANLDHCTVSNSGTAGIYVTSSSPRIERTTIRDCGTHGIHFASGAPDMGTAANPGYNVFRRNAQYHYYNPTATNLYAIGNDWGAYTVAGIGAKIYDKNDNPSYGYVYFEPFLGPLWSDNFSATAYPNGAKLAQEGVSGNLHVTFQRLGKVCYSSSADGGATWLDAEELADPYGYPFTWGGVSTPSIALAPADNAPWVVYNRILNGFFDELRLARRTAEGWTYRGLPGISNAGPGSVFFRSPASITVKPGGSDPDTAIILVEETLGNATIGTTLKVRLLMATLEPFEVVTNADLYTAFFPSQPWPERSPSVAVDINSLCHSCFSVKGDVWHVAQNADGTWSAPERISELGTDASEGFIDAFQDSLAVVWAVQEAGGKEVYRMAQQVGRPWGEPLPVSQTPNQDSEHPVSANGVAFWTENAGGNFETYYQKKDGTLVNLSNTAGVSVYPSAVTGSANLYAAWTETNGNPEDPYSPCISNVNVAATGLEGKKTYYAVGIGGAEPSSYTISRDGYYEYPSGISVDYASDELVYSLPYLAPDDAYALQVVGYHESSDRWNQQVKLDGLMARVLKVTAHVPETLTIDIPQGYYAEDGKVELRVRRLTGDYAAVSNITLFRKASSGGKGGAQAAEEDPVRSRGGHEFRLMPCYPNPASARASFSFCLPKEGQASLKIYNIQGQLVRTLVNGGMEAGPHGVVWDGKDDGGRLAANGTYLYRLASGSATATKKLIYIK
jgi:hypothetical protein